MRVCRVELKLEVQSRLTGKVMPKMFHIHYSLNSESKLALGYNTTWSSL